MMMMNNGGFSQIWASAAPLMAALIFFKTILHDLLPLPFRMFITQFLSRAVRPFSRYSYYDITEFDGGIVNTNELYHAVQTYLSHLATITSNAAAIPSRITLSRNTNSSTFTFGLPSGKETITDDSFSALRACWEHVVTPRANSPNSFSWRQVPDEKRAFILRIPNKQKHLFFLDYLDHIIRRASEIRRNSRERLLYTHSSARYGAMDARGNYPWESVIFKHPSTFDTLAMEPEKKLAIMEDLSDFIQGESFYQRTGRAWKRGYLLYGPPGTGKSSMIAAMANYLKYDIYDLELSEVQTNSDLRKLLMKTTNKSIIVIEDIDCSINLTDRVIVGKLGTNSIPPSRKTSCLLDSCTDQDRTGNKFTTVTLSGLLNFTDGLWSSCGSERIFIFTTNHIERLDPALLRSGRMDMHIHMGYCSFPALKILKKNYVGDDDHDDHETGASMRELEGVIKEAEITPADVSEVLIRNRHDGKKAAAELLKELKRRIEMKSMSTKLVLVGIKSDEVVEKRELESSVDAGVAPEDMTLNPPEKLEAVGAEERTE